MSHMSTIRRGIAATGVAGLLSIGLATSAFADPPEGEDANQPENWETYLEEEGYVDVECMKLEDGFEGDSWVSDDDYLLVVLKYATINEEFWFVEEDEELSTETGQDISHIIVCQGEEEETSTPTPTPTPSGSETPTPTPSGSETPTPTPSDSETPTPPVTPPGGPLVETDVPSSGNGVTPAVLGGAAILAGLGLAAGAMRRKGEH